MALDTGAILRSYCMASGTSLYALIGTRFFMPRMPAPEEWKNASAAIVALRRGGVSNPDVPIKRPSYQIECYGGSQNPRDAEAVYEALYDRLRAAKMASTASGTLMSATEEAPGQDVFDSFLEWPFVLTFWEIECRETS